MAGTPPSGIEDIEKDLEIALKDSVTFHTPVTSATFKLTLIPSKDVPDGLETNKFGWGVVLGEFRKNLVERNDYYHVFKFKPSDPKDTYEKPLSFLRNRFAQRILKELTSRAASKNTF